MVLEGTTDAGGRASFDVPWSLGPFAATVSHPLLSHPMTVVGFEAEHPHQEVYHNDYAALEAWRRGRTGYPVIDAGMRELWHTGFMHNRLRMVVADFAQTVADRGFDARYGGVRFLESGSRWMS